MKKLSQGFTLVELIVVIVIISIITGSAIAAYSTYANFKASDSETKQLIDTLELAKKKASTNDLSTPCDANDPNNPNMTFTGFQVVINSQKYDLILHCVDSGGDQDITKIITTHMLPTKITITSPTPKTIEFKPLVAGPSMSDTNNITIYNSSSQKYSCISVSATGVIDQLPNSSCISS